MVTVSSGNNLWLRRRVTCDWDRIPLKRGSSLQMRLSFWCGTWYLSNEETDGILRKQESWMRATIQQDSDGILQKQSRSAKSQVQFKSHHSKKRIKLTDVAFFGWKSKGIRKTLGVLIYDCHLAVCVYPTLWNLWYPNKNYPRERRYPPEAI